MMHSLNANAGVQLPCNPRRPEVCLRVCVAGWPSLTKAKLCSHDTLPAPSHLKHRALQNPPVAHTLPLAAPAHHQQLRVLVELLQHLIHKHRVGLHAWWPGSRRVGVGVETGGVGAGVGGHQASGHQCVDRTTRSSMHRAGVYSASCISIQPDGFKN